LPLPDDGRRADDENPCGSAARVEFA
jgi:hypothetical protein